MRWQSVSFSEAPPVNVAHRGVSDYNILPSQRCIECSASPPWGNSVIAGRRDNRSTTTPGFSGFWKARYQKIREFRSSAVRSHNRNSCSARIVGTLRTSPYVNPDGGHKHIQVFFSEVSAICSTRSWPNSVLLAVRWSTDDIQ